MEILFKVMLAAVGFAIGVGIGYIVVNTAHAQSEQGGMVRVGDLTVSWDYNVITKVYDYDNGVVCYLYRVYSMETASISCLRN